MKFIPAPLSATVQSAHDQFAKLLPSFDHYQIDVQDGVYVPSTTISVNEYLGVIESLRKAQNKKRVTLDFHLMLADYAQAIQDVKVGIDQYPNIIVRTVFVHTNIAPALLNADDLSLSMTLSPPDEVATWAAYFSHSLYAQVMTIYPGPQGQSLMPEMLRKIGEIRVINPKITICIDGAVSDKTLPIICSQRREDVPDELGVGSYFSKAPVSEIEERKLKLEKLVHCI